MLNELKATLSIILVSCMISTLYEYVEAALAVTHSKSNAELCFCMWELAYCIRNRGDLDSVSVSHLEKDNYE